MTFHQKLADFVLGNTTILDLPEVAMMGLNEGYESESLIILAGFCKYENGFEILSYFKKALSELNIELKSEKEAAIEMIHFYVDEILNERIDAIEGIKIIIKDILDVTSLLEETESAAYDSIAFDRLYSLYWKIDEFLDYDYSVETDRFTNEIRQELLLWKKKIHLIES